MKHLITITLLLSFFSLMAQEKDNKFSFGGSVDAYYKTNLTSTDKVNPLFGDLPQSFDTSFADETGFALAMANLIVSYENGNVGAVADVVFGPRGDAAIGQDKGEGHDGYYLNQLYAYWNVSENTTLTLGRFNTYLGYEVISPTGNFNYSTSYLFSSGPFSHVGIKADFALSEDFSLMLAFMNPTDTNNSVGGYALGVQLGYKGQLLNFYYDDKEILGFEIDYTGGFDVSEDFFLGINAAYADNDGNGFYGGALYPQYNFSEMFSLGLRGEYFGTFVDVAGVDDSTVFATTLTGNIKIKDLTIIPELRLDSWSEDLYYDHDLQPTKSLAAFILAAVYKFE